MKKTLTFLFLLVSISLFGQGLNADGPYVLHVNDSTKRVISVSTDGVISDSFTGADTFTVSEHDGRWSFDVKLHELKRPDWKRPMPEKMFIMSDPHGRMDCFVSILQAGKVIDERLGWAFGEGELFIIGDVFDRGEDVPQIFWLIYKLEDEAAKAGGRVTFVYGNHETMVLAGDYRYMKPKYKALADTLGMKYRQLWGPDTELGRWLSTKNTMEVVGDAVFVHAGLSTKLIEQGADIPTINETVSKGLFMTKKERNASEGLIPFMFGSDGPIWYRGLVLNKKKYNPSDTKDVKKVLSYFGVKRLFVGHTIFKNIKSTHRGLVTAVNVDNKSNMEAGRGRALLIEKGKIYLVGDSGIMHEYKKAR